VTDVDLVAGLLEDGAVLGGEVTLSRSAARAAVEDVAGQLGPSTEAAAGRIEAVIDGQLGSAMAAFLAERHIRPGDVTLYAFGGAGPLHFARAATAAGIRRLRTFAFGGVFSAFGCTAVDVRHRYEVLIPGPGMNRDAACAAIDALVRRAGWDLSAEGFSARAGTCRLVVEGVDGQALSGTPAIAFEPGVAAPLVDAAWPLPDGATTLAVIVNVPAGELRTTGPTGSAISAGRDRGAGAEQATANRSRERRIWWGEEVTVARVIAVEDLAAGELVAGPLLIVDGDAAAAVPADWLVRREPDGSLLWEAAG
jgi:N-methylhydantoinase A